MPDSGDLFVLNEDGEAAPFASERLARSIVARSGGAIDEREATRLTGSIAEEIVADNERVVSNARLRALLPRLRPGIARGEVLELVRETSDTGAEESDGAQAAGPFGAVLAVLEGAARQGDVAGRGEGNLLRAMMGLGEAAARAAWRAEIPAMIETVASEAELSGEDIEQLSANLDGALANESDPTALRRQLGAAWAAANEAGAKANDPQWVARLFLGDRDTGAPSLPHLAASTTEAVVPSPNLRDNTFVKLASTERLKLLKLGSLRQTPLYCKEPEEISGDELLGFELPFGRGGPRQPPSLNTPTDSVREGYVPGIFNAASAIKKWWLADLEADMPVGYATVVPRGDLFNVSMYQLQLLERERDVDSAKELRGLSKLIIGGLEKAREKAGEAAKKAVEKAAEDSGAGAVGGLAGSIAKAIAQPLADLFVRWVKQLFKGYESMPVVSVIHITSWPSKAPLPLNIVSATLTAPKDGGGAQKLLPLNRSFGAERNPRFALKLVDSAARDKTWWYGASFPSTGPVPAMSRVNVDAVNWRHSQNLQSGQLKQAADAAVPVIKVGGATLVSTGCGLLIRFKYDSGEYVCALRSDSRLVPNGKLSALLG